MSRKHQFSIFLLLLIVFRGIPLSADTVHVLARGETLYSLSRHYGVSLEALLEKNNITDPSDLSVGTQLIIPSTSGNRSDGETELYTVAGGDTYYGIARKFHLDVDALLSMNGRDSSRVLRVGETLHVRADSADKPVDFPDSPGESIPGGSGAEPADVSRVTRVGNVPWWPVAGYKHPLDGKLDGVFIEADPLSYVHAVAGGNVVWTGPYRGFGHVVLVDSNGYIYLYGGNEDLFVNVGQTIAAGSRIGRLGSSGPEGGKQNMIFSVFREGVPVSPDEAPRG